MLDTNIVTAILKNDVRVNQKLQELDFQGKTASISGISYYEVKRGLLATNATRKLSEFAQLCQIYPVLFWNDLVILEKASEIYANLQGQGKLLEDADILIAAISVTRGLILVSNDSDMLRIQGVMLENWLGEKN